MQFTSDPIDMGQESDGTFLGLQSHDIVRLIETVMLVLLGLMMMLLVIKPLVSRIIEAIGEASLSSNNAQQDSLTHNQTAINQSVPASAITQNARPIVASTQSQQEPSSMVTLDQVDGEIRKSSLNRVSEIIDKHPDETVSLVRNWMNQ